MVKLVWKVPGQAPLAFPLRQERVSIGRDAGNDIRLPEPAVSSRHATIIQRAGRVVLHDLKSSNGTWVNGARVDNQELVHGDVVAFGRVVMHYIDEAQEAPPPPRPPPTLSSGPLRVVVGGKPAAAPAPASAPAAMALDSTLPPLAATLGPPAAVGATLPPPMITDDSPRFIEPVLEQTIPGNGAISDTIPGLGLATDPGAAPDLVELDRLLGSIRSFRDQETDVFRQRQAEMLREWRATIAYAEAMKQRLAGETRIRFFDVSERRHEIVLRIVRAPGEPTKLLSLTWGHPDQRDRAPDGIWRRASSHQDRRFEKSTEAIRELVATLAAFLA